MKKVILIVAVLVIALVGLTSYNGKEVKKDKADGNLIAQVNSGGQQIGGTRKSD